jgi:hypothetical protein
MDEGDECWRYRGWVLLSQYLILSGIFPRI